jgi:hypothetical protein
MNHHTLLATRLLLSCWLLAVCAAQEWRVVDRPTPVPAITYDSGRQCVQVLDQRAELYEATEKRWLLRPTPAGLPAAGAASLCYDPTRRRTVALVVTNRLQPAATYEWDGVGWTVRATIHAPVFSTHALTYDSVRNVVLALGRNEVRGGMDTWSYDGTDWSLQSLLGPPVPQSMQMTFDRARSVAVAILTAFSSAAAFQTWEWNGTAWTQRVIAVPLLRDYYAFGYDDRRQRTLLAGGTGSKGLFGDAWEYDGATWRNVTGGALPMLFVGCTYAEHRRALQARSAAGDLYEWTGATWQLLIQRERPPVTQMAWDSRRGSMLCFGGSIVLGPVRTFFGDTWEHRGEGWQKVGPLHAPSPRTGHAVWSDGVDVWLWGGELQSTRQSNETWRFDGRDWNLVPVAVPPPGRTLAGVAYDALRNRAVLFGGENNTGLLGDTWLFDGATWTQAQPQTPPPPRSKMAIAWDRGRGRTVMLHGRGPNGPMADAWEWDGAQWAGIASVAATSPFGRATLAYDAQQGQLALFTAEIGQIGVFTFDGLVWTRRQGPGDYSPFGELQAATEGRGALLVDSGIVWRRGASLAQAESFGPACSGGGMLAASVVPAFGAEAFALDAWGLPPSAPLLLLVGATQVSVPLGSCTQRVGNPETLLLAADLRGNLRWSVTVPDLPVLRGVPVFAQMASLTNGGGGVALSRGLRLRMGD